MTLTAWYSATVNKRFGQQSCIELTFCTVSKCKQTSGQTEDTASSNVKGRTASENGKRTDMKIKSRIAHKSHVAILHKRYILMKKFFQLSPSMFPLTISILFACGFFGNPGIRIMSPAIATIISAPRFITISLM